MGKGSEFLSSLVCEGQERKGLEGTNGNTERMNKTPIKK